MKCIYCKEDKSSTEFKKREHIIPQCFGKFRSNLVLKNIVCDDCNQLFGDTIELFWGRDSFESLERLRQGIKSKGNLKRKFKTKSKVYKGKFKGAIVKEKELSDSGQILVEKVLQAGFFHPQDNEYHYFEIGHIPSKKKLEEDGYQIIGKMVMLIAEGNELDLLIDELHKNGINVKSESELIIEADQNEEVQVETEITLDRVIMRGISKIAFNYLAYVAGKQFCLSDHFNGIRKFIRYNEGESQKFIAVNQSPILYDDQVCGKLGAKITEGHIITVGWNKKSIVSKISLFNTATYGVKICDSYNGIWIPIKSGHHFDNENKEVSKLLGVNRRLMR